jgi:hypothetical protein
MGGFHGGGFRGPGFRGGFVNGGFRGFHGGFYRGYGYGFPGYWPYYSAGWGYPYYGYTYYYPYQTYSYPYVYTYPYAYSYPSDSAYAYSRPVQTSCPQADGTSLYQIKLTYENDVWVTQSYWYSAGTLNFVTLQGELKKTPANSIDRALTFQLNRNCGVNFQLP